MISVTLHTHTHTPGMTDTDAGRSDKTGRELSAYNNKNEQECIMEAELIKTFNLHHNKMKALKQV